MGQRQSWTRLFGIGVVICGLSLPMTEYKVDHDQDGSPELLWGVALTFCGTFFYALEYTLCERAFTLYDKPVDSKELCFQTGAWGICFTAIWFAAYTIPHWHELVVEEVADANGSPLLIALLFATHTSAAATLERARLAARARAARCSLTRVASPLQSTTACTTPRGSWCASSSRASPPAS